VCTFTLTVTPGSAEVLSEEIAIDLPEARFGTLVVDLLLLKFVARTIVGSEEAREPVSLEFSSSMCQ
jgi:hypothetical protein